MADFEKRQVTPALSRRIFGLAGAVAFVGVGASLLGSWSAAEAPRLIPSPEIDLPTTAGAETAVLAGGCFWGVQGVFQHVVGVTSAISGYAGGMRSDANYDAVSAGTTRHAEAVKVTYDPSQISFGQILQVFFSVAHDPTQLNRQGPDVGTQYRSAIFPQNDEQARIARAYIGQLDKKRVFGSPIVTQVETDKDFYPAEAYHQDFMTRNPGNPYIAMHDLPKVASLKHLFANQYRAKPILVSDRASN